MASLGPCRQIRIHAGHPTVYPGNHVHTVVGLAIKSDGEVQGGMGGIDQNLVRLEME